MEIIKFTFGPFSENTYVLADQKTKECLIIDPGMYDDSERTHFKEHLINEGLTPTFLLNTHCHIDHVMGNSFVHDTYGLKPLIHKSATEMLERAELAANLYGLNYDKSPEGETILEEGVPFIFHDHKLEIFFTPGHSPGHVVLFNREEGYLIGGDLLFKESIGRVDLPGSVPEDLVHSIQQKIYVLPEETEIYPGHGPTTTVGHEKNHNPFVTIEKSFLG